MSRNEVKKLPDDMQALGKPAFFDVTELNDCHIIYFDFVGKTGFF